MKSEYWPTLRFKLKAPLFLDKEAGDGVVYNLTGDVLEVLLKRPQTVHIIFDKRLLLLFDDNGLVSMTGSLPPGVRTLSPGKE